MAKKKAATEEATAKSPPELVDAYVQEFMDKAGAGFAEGKAPQRFPSGKTILESDQETQIQIVGGIVEQLVTLKDKRASTASLRVSDWQVERAKLHNQSIGLRGLLEALLKLKLPLNDAILTRLLCWPAEEDDRRPDCVSHCLKSIAKVTEEFALAHEIGDQLREAIIVLVRLIPTRGTGNRENRKVADRLSALVPGGHAGCITPVAITSGEAWSDAAIEDLKKLKGTPAQSWNIFLLHCQTGGAKPFSDRWLNEAQPLLEAVGFDSFKEHVVRWFPLVDKPRTQSTEEHRWGPDPSNLIQAPHLELLRGLVWCSGFREDAELARALMRLALSSYRKLPGVGPRFVALGNACVKALGMMPGRAPIAQLAVLKVKVKFGTAQKEVEKAFNDAAAREGLPRDEIDELAAPSYGLEEVGVRRETFGDYTAELIVDGSSASLIWLKGEKILRSAPATVRSEHPEEYKELQTAVKDMKTMLPAQRERIDMLFLEQKTWPFATWQERYLDHPLVGTIARRLIWTFLHRGKSRQGIWHEDELRGSNGKPLNIKGEPTVSLWHPIDSPTEQILEWREWLERREVVQPFKQAHREVYLLTDAERRTGTYSNRYAAHVIRQHQFNALCQARGWNNRLRLMVDDSYPPAQRRLPKWNLRAEYWVEGAGSDYGIDTNESGVYLYLATDQVRFYAIDAAQMYAHAGGGGYGRWRGDVDEPVPLGSIPPLVFSEVMRDVDLFVGVGSVGNDPNWADGGPGGRYRTYWENYSFGDLSGTATTRRDLLQRLVPRLKIADRCSFSDRFLVVRGDIRSYKIHLGSGNILMTPNDQYLCIVPKQTQSAGEKVFLPFEGDNTLSVILSKAFLLAEDTKIKDPTITSQLNMGT